MDEEYIRGLVHEQMLKEKEKIIDDMKKENDKLKEKVYHLEKEFIELKKEMLSFKYETTKKFDEFMDDVEDILKGGTLPLFLSIVSISLGGIMIFFGVFEVNTFLNIINTTSSKSIFAFISSLIMLFLGFMLLTYAYDVLKKRI